MTETEENKGTRYEQVVARRLSMADRSRGRTRDLEQMFIMVVLFVVILELGAIIMFLWRIIAWINGGVY